MKRLSEERHAPGEPGQDDVSARLGALLAVANAAPEDVFRKRRVRVALDARLRARGPRVRPVRALAVLLTLVGTAAAMSGLLLPSDPGESDAAPASSPSAASSPARPTSPPQQSQGVPEAERSDKAAPAKSVAASPAEEPSAPAKSARAPLGARAKSQQGPRLASATSEGEDPTQVVEAVRALRKQNDPKRAQTLLDGYLAKNPDGALSEEALALSMEAAAANKSPRAAEYARRYLERFPQGRHAAFARRLVAR